MKYSKFEYVTKIATEPVRSWTNKEVAMFHYWNPNGILSQRQLFDKKINEFVDSGVSKSGAILAYGSLSYLDNLESLRKLATSKRVSQRDLYVTIKMFRYSIESVQKHIEKMETQ